MAKRQAISLIGAAILLGIVLAGCGGEQAPDNQTPTVAVSPTSVPTPTFGTPVWTESVDPATNQPLKPVTAFPDTASRITIAVSVEYLPPSASLIATWFFNDVELTELETVVEVEEGIDRGWIELHLDRQSDDVWPDGQYRVILTLEGTNIADSTIEVERT